MTEVSEVYEGWYKNLIEKKYGHEVSQMIASLAAYEGGEITISESVKEKLMELKILRKDKRINIKNPRNKIEWIELAIKLQVHYINNNFRF
jgi:hypothetical protein